RITSYGTARVSAIATCSRLESRDLDQLPDEDFTERRPWKRIAERDHPRDLVRCDQPPAMDAQILRRARHARDHGCRDDLIAVRCRSPEHRDVGNRGMTPQHRLDLRRVHLVARAIDEEARTPGDHEIAALAPVAFVAG